MRLTDTWHLRDSNESEREGCRMFSSNRSRYRHVTRFERNGKASEYFSTVVLFTAQYQDECGERE